MREGDIGLFGLRALLFSRADASGDTRGSRSPAPAAPTRWTSLRAVVSPKHSLEPGSCEARSADTEPASFGVAAGVSAKQKNSRAKQKDSVSPREPNNPLCAPTNHHSPHSALSGEARSLFPFSMTYLIAFRICRSNMTASRLEFSL